MEQYKKTLENAISIFGNRLQCEVAVEEMAELTKEIIKNFRGKQNRENIIEEVADVQIMIEQIKIIFNCFDEVENEIKNKMERLSDRVDNIF